MSRWFASHPRCTNFVALAAGVAACLGILTVVYRLDRADLRVPFRYVGDAVLIQTMIKSIADHGWYLTNPSLGCPGSLEMQDFPVADNLHVLILKLLTMCTRDSALAFNLYFLVTFPLTSLTTHLAMRRLGFGHGPAIMTGLLFAFLPCHFLRGENHLFLAAYYLIPPMMWVILSLYLDRGILLATNPHGGNVVWTWKRKGTWTALALCALIASAGIYYAFFACAFLFVAGSAAALSRRRVYPMTAASIFIATVGVGAVATLAPTLLYYWQNGSNPEIQRYWMESETYGLKLTQLLLPVSGHRWKTLANLREHYDQSLPINENSCASNGLIASIGFLLLIGRLFVRKHAHRERPDLRDGLSILTIGGVLLATLGGLGTMVSLLGFHWIRAYNRISVYLGFLALLAVATLWQRLSQRRGTSRTARVGIAVGGTLLLIAGVADQTTRRFVPRYAELKRSYEQDEEYFREVEALCPPGGMIFQLPYIPFPEHPPPGHMAGYDHLRAYLHTNQVRWSYGAMKGRDADLCIRDLAELPPAKLVQALAYAGYCGIYVNRVGYADQAADLEDVFTEILGTDPLVNADQTLLFFPLTSYADAFQKSFTEEDWRIMKEKTLCPVRARFGNGFSYPERQGDDTFRWGSPDATAIVENDLAYARQVRLEMDCRSFGNRPAALGVDGSVAAGTYSISSASKQIVWQGTLPPGRHVLRFRIDGPKFKAPFAPYQIGFQLYNFTFKEVD